MLRQVLEVHQRIDLMTDYCIANKNDLVVGFSCTWMFIADLNNRYSRLGGQTQKTESDKRPIQEIFESACSV